MRNIILFTLILFFIHTSTVKAQIKNRKVENPVFVFNNAFNEREISYSDISDLLFELGYDGIEHREVEGIFELKKELDRNRLKLYADYLQIDLDAEQPYLPEWREVIPELKGTGIILWVHIHSTKYKPSDHEADEVIVPILQELADLAKPYGIRIAIYHHRNFVAETVEDSYRLAKKTKRDNVGAVFNLVHFLSTDKEENMEQVIKDAAPYLFAASISGSEKGDIMKLDINKQIQPVGEGSFDVYKAVKLLLDNGFKGPIGFQCYKIPGNPEEFLKTSMEAWKGFKSLYESGVNTLSQKEKSNGWELLFDGYSTKGWRGITQQEFPTEGWEVKNGEIRVNATDGAESGNGGDIVTTEEYGDFELSWEWKMRTKGGNSGLKYYVKEELTQTGKYGYGLEYQILDDANHPWMLEGKMKPNDYHTMGALYEFFAPSDKKHVKPLGEWNTSRIISKDNYVEHWLNGQKILEYERGGKEFNKMMEKSKFKDVENFGQEEKGHILLQDHGSKVHFRNIKIRKL